jgi:hypothetical protein
MEIKIDKAFFIKLIIVVILCISCFCLGRFLRFSDKSNNAENLVDGITISQETAKRMAQKLNIGEAALESADLYEKAVIDGLDTLSESNEKGLECMNMLNEAFIANRDITEKYKSLKTDVIVNELKKAQEQALVYEKLFNDYKALKEEK